MKLTVLLDNNTYIDQYFFGEPGLSYLLETDTEKILFDTGYSGIYLKNAKLMHVDLSNITHLIISHGHSDHTGGITHLLNYGLKNVQFIAHPNCFDKKRKNGKDIAHKAYYLNYTHLIHSIIHELKKEDRRRTSGE